MAEAGTFLKGLLDEPEKNGRSDMLYFAKLKGMQLHNTKVTIQFKMIKAPSLPQKKGLFGVALLHCSYHVLLCLWLLLLHSVCCFPTLSLWKVLASFSTQPYPCGLPWKAAEITELEVGALGPAS